MWNVFFKGNGNKNKNGISTETIEKSTIYVNGVDRIDNLVGYTDGNCVPCCQSCNIAKNSFSVEEFTKQTESRHLLANTINKRIQDFIENH